MADLTLLDPASLVNELELTLDSIYALAGALGLGISPEGDYKVKVEKEDAETHRKRAKLALSQVKVRDLVEAIANSKEAQEREPLLLAPTMTKLINVYNLMELTSDAKQYFDLLKPLIKSNGSFFQVSASLNLLVLGYLDEGRYQQAINLYYEMLKLSDIDEMIHGLVRAAFNLISRLVMSQQLSRAHKIYNSMKLYCPYRPELELVNKERDESEAPGEAQAGAAFGADGAGQSRAAGRAKGADGEGQGVGRTPPDRNLPLPVLTLVNSRLSAEGGGDPDGGPAEEDYFDFDANLIRCQAAINLLSGYAVTGQANKALNVYQTITEYEDIDEYVFLKSMASVNLIRAFIQAQRWKEAFRYYKKVLLLNKKSDNSVLLAKAAVELIGFAEKKNLADAEYVAESLKGLSQDEEFVLEYTRALGNLIFIYGDFNELDKARALYETLGSYGDSLDLLAVRAKSTVNLMSDYCVAKRLDEAEKLFESLQNFSNHSSLNPSKVQGAHNLMAGYLKANKVGRAEEIFKGLARYGNSPNISILRGRATLSIVDYFVHQKDLEKVLYYYKTYDELNNHHDVLLERGKALVNLVTFVGNLGLTTLAKNHFMEFFELAQEALKNQKAYNEDDYEDDSMFEDSSLNNLNAYPVGGNSELVAQFIEFSDRDEFDSSIIEEESISSLLAKASFNLIFDYCESLNFVEAEAIYQTMFSLDLENESVAFDVSQAGYLIISVAVPLNKWPLVLRVFESFSQLPKTKPINNQRCLVGVNILNYNAQRKLQVSQLIYDTLMEIHPKTSFGHFIAKAALDTIVGLVKEKRLDEALKVYKSMADLGRDIKTLEKRANAAAYLMKAYESMGYLAEAKKLYQSMSTLGINPKVTKLRLRAAKSLANLMKNSGLIEAAKELHAETCGFKKFKQETLEPEKTDDKTKKTVR
ncbi:MAG: hypothetical protein LBF38_02790 [Deltaproteobacteria bacterium]|jgi:tetratricopeptide (TPR) repeat protein|nr:hypothetical protein [Deltaproteobacteria bacterium]